jgi:hypothetical protein
MQQYSMGTPWYENNFFRAPGGSVIRGSRGQVTDLPGAKRKPFSCSTVPQRGVATALKIRTRPGVLNAFVIRRSSLVK